MYPMLSKGKLVIIITLICYNYIKLVLFKQHIVKILLLFFLLLQFYNAKSMPTLFTL